MPKGAAEEPTGERFVPEAMAGSLIEAEHYARYCFGADSAPGRRVLDAGCGVGWGSRILHMSGAASVIGVDVDAGALADARRRVPGVEFVLGDLAKLPFQDARFDLVTCFEAIEHVADPRAVLDELRRVLAPGGVVFVSSPNPCVYPAGNAFHVHEFEPEELRVELARRFTRTRLWLEHAHLAATVSSVDATPVVDARKVLMLVHPSVDTTVYGIVVASDDDLPDLRGVAVMTTSRQFDELVAERAEFLRDHERIVEERTRLIGEHGRAHAEANRLAAENTVLRSELIALEERLRRAESRLDATLVDRDQTLLMLLEAEQELSTVCGRPAHPSLP